MVGSANGAVNETKCEIIKVYACVYSLFVLLNNIFLKDNNQYLFLSKFWLRILRQWPDYGIIREAGHAIVKEVCFLNSI